MQTRKKADFCHFIFFTLFQKLSYVFLAIIRMTGKISGRKKWLHNCNQFFKEMQQNSVYQLMFREPLSVDVGTTCIAYLHLY